MPYWTELELPTEKMKELAESRGVEPIRMYVTEFDTSVAVEREALMAYLGDPLPVLTGETSKRQQDDSADEELRGLVLEGVEPDWSIVTVLRNHHQALWPRIFFALATVSQDEKTVYQDFYKQLGPATASSSGV